MREFFPTTSQNTPYVLIQETFEKCNRKQIDPTISDSMMVQAINNKQLRYARYIIFH